MSQPAAMDQSEMRSDVQRMFDSMQAYQADVRSLMHDGLCQSLGSAILMAGTHARSADAKSQAIFQELSALLEAALLDARAMAYRLMPLGTGPGALMEGLDNLARSSAIPCDFICEDPVLVEDPYQALSVYRLAEAILADLSRRVREGKLTLSLINRGEMATISLISQGELSEEWHPRSSIDILARAACVELRRSTGTRPFSVSWDFSHK